MTLSFHENSFMVNIFSLKPTAHAGVASQETIWRHALKCKMNFLQGLHAKYLWHIGSRYIIFSKVINFRDTITCAIHHILFALT